MIVAHNKVETMKNNQLIEALSALYQQLSQRIPKSERYHRQDAIFLLLVECGLGLIPAEYASFLQSEYFFEEEQKRYNPQLINENNELKGQAIRTFLDCLNL